MSTFYIYLDNDDDWLVVSVHHYSYIYGQRNTENIYFTFAKYTKKKKQLFIEVGNGNKHESLQVYWAKTKKKIILLKQQLQKQQLNFKIFYKKLKLKQKQQMGRIRWNIDFFIWVGVTSKVMMF